MCEVCDVWMSQSNISHENEEFLPSFSQMDLQLVELNCNVQPLKTNWHDFMTLCHFHPPKLPDLISTKSGKVLFHCILWKQNKPCFPAPVFFSPSPFFSFWGFALDIYSSLVYTSASSEKSWDDLSEFIYSRAALLHIWTKGERVSWARELPVVQVCGLTVNQDESVPNLHILYRCML